GFSRSLTQIPSGCRARSVATSETPRCVTTGSIVFVRSSRSLAYPLQRECSPGRSSYEPLPGWLTLLARPRARPAQQRRPPALRPVLLLPLSNALLEPETIGCAVAQGCEARPNVWPCRAGKY